jgi:hypothetical protein
MVMGVAGVALSGGLPGVRFSTSLSSSGGCREFSRLVHEADEAHRQFSAAAHEARQLELDLDAAKVALAASDGEFATALAAITVVQTHIVGKGLLHLNARMDVCSR